MKSEPVIIGELQLEDAVYAVFAETAASMQNSNEIWILSKSTNTLLYRKTIILNASLWSLKKKHWSKFWILWVSTNFRANLKLLVIDFSQKFIFNFYNFRKV